MSRLYGFLRDGLRVTATLPLLALVRCYQIAVSPWLPRACRFQPTCSAYAIQALMRHGPIIGTWKAVRRIGRCHPWSEGGWDPP